MTPLQTQIEKMADYVIKLRGADTCKWYPAYYHQVRKIAESNGYFVDCSWQRFIIALNDRLRNAGYPTC